MLGMHGRAHPGARRPQRLSVHDHLYGRPSRKVNPRKVMSEPQREHPSHLRIDRIKPHRRRTRKCSVPLLDMHYRYIG